MKWVWTVALGGVLWVQGVWGDCVQTGPCSCQDPKGAIDLSPLNGQGSPRFKDKQTSTTDPHLYSWNPCSPFTELDSCNTVSACQVSRDRTLSYPLGTQDTATFSMDSVTGDLTLQYSATDPTTRDQRTLSILLVCDPDDNPGTLTVIGQTIGLAYAMSLNSYYCCPGAVPHAGGDTEGLSVGSVLVILFFSLLLVYVVAGVLFLKFVRKAEGREVIPNYSVWIVLPGLFKDGALFSIRRASSLCGRSGAYENI